MYNHKVKRKIKRAGFTPVFYNAEGGICNYGKSCSRSKLGDEGKGKITDMLAKEADIIVRFQGGANAGHTIVNNYGKFALHTLPSGCFYGHTTSIIGNGVALNIPVLFKEIQDIVAKGVPMPKILVSDRAQMVMPYHVLFDQYEEERLGGKSFGSTKSGIAPFYSDKYAKIGFQVSELFDEELLKEKVVRVCETKNVTLEHLYHKPLLDPDELLETLHQYKEMVEPYVCDVSTYLWNAIKEGKEILLEGQLGTLKDPDHGIYPMVHLLPRWQHMAQSAQVSRHTDQEDHHSLQSILKCSRRRCICQRDLWR